MDPEELEDGEVLDLSDEDDEDNMTDEDDDEKLLEDGFGVEPE